MTVPPDPSRSARDRLGDELVAAAVRQHEGRGSRVRVRRRAVVSLTVALLLGAGAVAGAARLIAVGEPLEDRTAEDARYHPAEGAPVLVAQAPDAARGHSWGVGLYTNADGVDCAIAGAVRGTTLGRIEDDRFRPYVRDFSGVCGASPLVWDILRSPGSPPRTIVFGRVSPAIRSVRMEHAGETREVPVGRGGFVAVFDGTLGLPDIRVTTG